MSAGRIFRLSALGVGLCLLAFAVFSGQILVGDPAPFDQWKRLYHVADVDVYLAWLDSDPSRWSAMRVYRAIDMVFPFVVFLFVASGVRLVWASEGMRRFVTACAVAYLLADYAENITLAAILNENGTAFTTGQVARAATLTMIKWATLAVVLALLVRGWLRARRG